MLHSLKPTKGSRTSRKRIGRGDGSGKGTYCGRGLNGQLSRAGGGKGPQFEGGQTPLIRRQPKRGGFKSWNRTEFEVINLQDLESRLDAGEYDVPALAAAKIVKGKKPVKLLGVGTITKKYVLTIDHASKAAKEAIEKGGGSVTLLR